MPDSWDASYKAGRDNPDYSPLVTPGGVDHNAYHAGGTSPGSWTAAFARQKASGKAFVDALLGGGGGGVVIDPGIGGGEGGTVAFLLLIPDLLPPAILFYRSRLYLTAQGLALWYIIAALGGEFLPSALTRSHRAPPL